MRPTYGLPTIIVNADMMNTWPVRIFMPEWEGDLLLYSGQSYAHYGRDTDVEELEIRARLGDSYWVKARGPKGVGIQFNQYAGTEHPPGQMKLPFTEMLDI